MTNADDDIRDDIDEGEDQDSNTDDENTDADEDEGTDDDSSADAEDEDEGDDSESDSDDESEEGAGDDEGDEDDSDEESDSKPKNRKQSTIDRLKKSRDKWKEKAQTGKGKSDDSDDSEDHALLARLESRGIMHPTDQAYVIKFAKAEGISPIKALKDQVVIDRLANNKKVRLQKKSVPTPGNRTGKVTKGVDYYIRKGILPRDPALAEKVQTEMAARAKAGR